MRILLAVVITLSTALTPLTHAQSLDHVINSDHRSQEHKQRDQYRHPQQTLEFFGLTPQQHVLELLPGTGWYSEILAPYLKGAGRLTAITFATDNLGSKDKKKVFWSKLALEYQQKMADKNLYGTLNFNEYDPPELPTYATENSVDLALVVRVLHALDEMGHIDDVFNALYKAVKPGGTLGVVQHRADHLSDYSSAAAEGYLSESYVVSVAEQAGFELIAKSEINANDKDTKNYPKGVYALPPTYGMGSADKSKYQAIGESDRMTLKFTKPKT